MTYTFRIKRFTLGVLDPPRFQDFKIISSPNATVLDVLERLRLEQDSSLRYRRSCHHGSCGTCGCVIDGIERLACVTRLEELGEQITIEPLNSFDCEGDLVVDTSPLLRKLSSHWATLRSVEGSSNDERLRLEDCIECGLCMSACPVVGGDSSFLGPAALAALHREVERSSDAPEELLALAASDRGISLCERSIDCSRRCPTGVSPARHIAILRKQLESATK